MKPFSSRAVAATWFLSAVFVALSCHGPNLRVGGLYSVRESEDGFQIVKILALDPDAVHIRLYKNKFPHRPRELDPTKLELGSINDPDGFGIGHLPVSPTEFASWFPVYVMQAAVNDDELEGYRIWKDSQGGVWEPK